MILCGVVAVHALLLSWLLFITRAPVVDPPAAVLSVISIKADRAAATPPPPPTLPAKIVKARREVSLAPPSSAETASMGGGAQGCDTLAAISAALLADDRATTAIVESPPESRSIADAIMMWNLRWNFAAPATDDGSLSAVRANLQSSLGAIEPQCLGEQVVGPRFIAVPAGERTIFIVIGSGNWQWVDLLRPDPLETPGAQSPAAPAPPPARQPAGTAGAART